MLQIYGMKFHYSYRSASIGFNPAAFLAGYQPKKIPMAEEKMNDMRID